MLSLLMDEQSHFLNTYEQLDKKKHVYTDTKSLQRVITYLLLLEQ